jgi:predicted nuclease of predicted toxin-antitoxin system
MVTLQFLADVNVEKPIIDYLRKTGFDVKWIPDFDCKMGDDSLLELARKENRILITNDKDFGELIFWQKKISHGVILFREKSQNSTEKIRLLSLLLKNMVRKIPHHFVSLGNKKIRVQPLEV